MSAGHFYPHNNVKFPQDLTAIREDSIELPSFDEAFNPDYLKQFFSKSDGNSKSPQNSNLFVGNYEETYTNAYSVAYTPYKEEHLYDETNHSVADTNDTYISPQKDTLLNGKAQIVNNLSYALHNTGPIPPLTVNNPGIYSQQPYGIPYSNGYNNPMYNNYNSNIRASIISETATKHTESLGANKINNPSKKKIFTIIRNAPFRPLLNISNIVQNTDTTKKKGRARRSIKDRLKSADNISLSQANYLGYELAEVKRRASYVLTEDLQSSKKAKLEKNLNEDFVGVMEFYNNNDPNPNPSTNTNNISYTTYNNNLHTYNFNNGSVTTNNVYTTQNAAGAGVRMEEFENLPLINFDDILNREYPEFTGNQF